MKMVFGVLSLLFAVAVIGVLAKKQLRVISGVDIPPATPVDVSSPIITPQQQSQQLQNQVKKSVEDAMQKPQTEVDDK
jgi:hypothetical protein